MAASGDPGAARKTASGQDQLARRVNHFDLHALTGRPACARAGLAKAEPGR